MTDEFYYDENSSDPIPKEVKSIIVSKTTLTLPNNICRPIFGAGTLKLDSS